MRITFSKSDTRGAGYCPAKSYRVKIDGEGVGEITEVVDSGYSSVGWRWWVSSAKFAIPWKNTSAEKLPLVATLAEAKARVKKHLLSVLKVAAPDKL